MAVPCLVNVVDPDEENWRRLERILCELFLVLRALLTPAGTTAPVTMNRLQRGPQPPPPRGGGQGPSGTSSVSNNGQTRLADTPPTQRRNGPRSTGSAPSCTKQSSRSSLQTWYQLGGELRDIADTLASRRHQILPGKKNTSVSIMSALCRILLGGSEPYTDID